MYKQGRRASGVSPCVCQIDRGEERDCTSDNTQILTHTLQVVSDCLRVLLEVVNAALIAPAVSNGTAAPQNFYRSSSSGGGNVALLAQQQLLRNVELLYALLHGQVCFFVTWRQRLFPFLGLGAHVSPVGHSSSAFSFLQDVLVLLRSQQQYLELVSNLQAIVDFFNRRLDDARAAESGGADPAAAGQSSSWSSVSK